LRVVEDTGKDVDGRDMSRSWTFASPQQAAKQRAEFESVLSAEQKAALNEAA
jgi:hypothetical protein